MWGERIVAVVVVAPGESVPTVETLLAHGRAELAGYKLPKDIYFVESLPRSAAGKVLRTRHTRAHPQGRAVSVGDRAGACSRDEPLFVDVLTQPLVRCPVPAMVHGIDVRIASRRSDFTGVTLLADFARRMAGQWSAPPTAPPSYSS